MGVKLLIKADPYPIYHDFLNSRNKIEEEDDSELSLQAEYESLLKDYQKSIDKASDYGGMGQYWINHSYGLLHRFTNQHPEFKLPDRYIIPVSDVEKNNRH
jgi:hypothetical protein